MLEDQKFLKYFIQLQTHVFINFHFSLYIPIQALFKLKFFSIISKLRYMPATQSLSYQNLP
jgi:hypothetical protein